MSIGGPGGVGTANRVHGQPACPISDEREHSWASIPGHQSDWQDQIETEWSPPVEDGVSAMAFDHDSWFSVETGHRTFIVDVQKSDVGEDRFAITPVF